MTNTSFIFWIVDIISSCTGIILSIAFLTILAIKISKERAFPFRSSCVIYIVYISSLYYFICTLLISTILPISNLFSANVNQHYLCHIMYYMAIPSVCITNLSVVNLFIYRLHICFKDTHFALSPFINYGFRIVLFLSWITNTIIALFIISTVPYNVYTQSIDHYNGTTCSIHENIQHQPYSTVLKVIMICSLFTMLIGYLVIWILFMIKLHKLLKELNATSDPKFIKLVQEQTLLVGIAVFSTLLLWSLNIVYSFGQFLVIVDTIVNITLIFVSFSFNKHLFRCFSCDRLVSCCCRKILVDNGQSDCVKVVTDTAVFAPDTYTVAGGTASSDTSASIQSLPKLHQSVTPFQTSQTLPFDLK